MTPTAGLAELDQQYRDMLLEFDRGAVRRKWRYQALWMAITILTFANMILAALAEHFSQQSWFTDAAGPVSPKFAANVLFSVIGVLIIGLTVTQTTAGLQGRWLSFRAAAEKLRRNCMLFRAGLPPFDGPDVDRTLAGIFDEVAQVAHKTDVAETQGRFSWKHALALWNLSEQDGDSPASTPDAGLLAGPIRGDGEVLDGRLRNQRQWYVRKARRYFRDYMLMQGGVVACSVFNVLHALVFGERIFWMIVVSSILSLGLIACRDFLDWGPLFVRYLQTARNLRTIEDAYRERRPPFDQGDDAARLRRLAEQVEQTLASEFQYWIYTRR